MKVLHITLVKQWFDMTDSGTKKEEYRELNDYWIRRLVDVSDYLKIAESQKDKRVIKMWFPDDILFDIKNGHNPNDVLKSYFSKFKSFDVVKAINGYGAKRPRWTRKFEGIEIREGRPEWGAEPGKKYLVIKLGEKIKPINA